MTLAHPCHGVVNAPGRMGLASSESSRKVVVGHSASTDRACLAEFGAHRAPYDTQNPHIRAANINSVPFLNSIPIRRYRRRTGREPILTITHAPHASPILAMRYHNTPRETPRRFGYNDCACATRNSSCRMGISQKASFRADCNDCACATRKLNCRKGISPNSRPRIDCDDYACATRKPNYGQELRRIFAVPVMHAPHVNWIAARGCGFFWRILAHGTLCALLERAYEPAWSALSRNVSSREDTVWDDAPSVGLNRSVRRTSVGHSGGVGRPAPNGNGTPHSGAARRPTLTLAAHLITIVSCVRRKWN